MLGRAERRRKRPQLLRTWMRGGGMRPIAAVALFATLFVAIPDRNWTFREARAASSPACVTGVGIGGSDSNTVADTVGGHGCVVIKYVEAGVVTYATFNYTGRSNMDGAKWSDISVTSFAWCWWWRCHVRDIR
jgi:hypothetical protein